jgi:Pyruvate/2-oxoacid:ferredoxin oxidoreductase delta subunit
VAARPTRGKVAICENILAMHSHIYGRRAQCGKVWPEPRLDLIKAHNSSTVATLVKGCLICRDMCVLVLSLLEFYSFVFGDLDSCNFFALL